MPVLRVSLHFSNTLLLFLFKHTYTNEIPIPPNGLEWM